MSVTCATGLCPDALRCIAQDACEMENIPVVKDASEPPKEQKRIDEMTLDEYRRGVERVMRSLSL